MMVTIKALASRIRMMRRAGQSYVPLLDAGCSYSSGIKDTPTMKEEIVRTVTGENDFDPGRFDDVWRDLSNTEQQAAIGQYFQGKEPSQGYHALADLVADGFFDLILTTNFDPLLEHALEEKGMDFGVFVVGVDKEEDLQQFLTARGTSLRLLKLHGDYTKSHYSYSLDQLLEFHPDAKDIFLEVSSEDMIVCGYAFRDLDILRALNLEEGSIYYVNTRQPDRLIREILRKKKSEHNCICGTKGDFDYFFATLRNEICSAT